ERGCFCPPLQNVTALTVPARQRCHFEPRNKVLKFTGVSMSKLRVATCALALVGLVPAAYGISQGLERLGPGKTTGSLTETRKSRSTGRSASKVALVIGNAAYPDANTPLAHPQKDAQELAEELRQKGFDVEVEENAGKDAMKGAFDRFKNRIKPGAVALVAY